MRKTPVQFLFPCVKLQHARAQQRNNTVEIVSAGRIYRELSEPEKRVRTRLPWQLKELLMCGRVNKSFQDLLT
jgi:hypothetical protein